MAKKELPKEVNIALDGLKVAYVDSPATTRAGIIIRIIVRFLPINLIVGALVSKLEKK